MSRPPGRLQERTGCGRRGWLVAALLIVSLSAGVRTVAQPSSFDLGFDFSTRQPVVRVSVNGGRAVPFIVDTGASIHLIDREVARAAGLARGEPATMSGGGQTAVDAQFVEGLTLKAGSRVWTGQRAALAGLGYPESKHFAGLLGAPILMRYTVQFAFDARKIRFFDPASYRPPAGAAPIPFELQEDLPIVRVTIDAGTGPIEARLMVDTGAATFVDLNSPFVNRHRLLDAIPNAPSSERPAALGGSAPFVYATGRQVTLGRHVFDRPRLGLSRATAGSSARAERDGIIGNDLLRPFTVTVDYRRQVLVLEPTAGPPPGARQP